MEIDIPELKGVERVSLERGDSLEIERKEGVLVLITLHGSGTIMKKGHPEARDLLLLSYGRIALLDSRRGEHFLVENPTVTVDEENHPLVFLIVRIQAVK